MAQIKVTGEQLNIQDVANDIGADSTAINSIATGLNSDPTMDANYLRLDGTVSMTGNLDLGANNLITTGNVDGRDISADGASLDTHLTAAPFTYSHTDIDTHIGDATIHRSINDSGTSVTELFSASEIIARLAGKSDTSHTHAIGTLSDVNVGGAASGEVLSYDGANWIPIVVTKTGISNSTGGIDVYTGEVGGTLQFNGVAAGSNKITVSLDGGNNNVIVDANSANIAAGFTLNDISNVVITGPTAASYLRWNGTTDWIDSDFGVDVTTELNANSIDALSDVDTTTSPPALSEVLTWDGTNWAPSVNPSGVTTFIALTDVPSTYGTDNNQFVMVDSGATGLVFVPANIDNLFDVDTATTPPNANEVLAYNGVDWVPQDGSVKTFYKAVKSTSGTLNVGDPVYIVGHNGTYITVELANASASSSMPAVGVVGTTVTDVAAGDIVTSGVVSGFDTSSWSVGAEVYISSAGGLASPAPAGETNQIQKVGEVLVQNATTGSIHVVGAGRSNSVSNLDNGNFFIGNGSNQTVSASFATSVTAELNTNSIDELSDVDTTTKAPVLNDGLIFDGTDWVNQAIDHTTLSNIGTNSHAAIDLHIADATIHFTQASISITESQISDLGTYEPAFTKNTGFNLDLGTTAGTVSEGDHTHVVADVTDFATGVTTELGLNSVSALSDVSYIGGSPSPAVDDSLVFDGTNWTNLATVLSFNTRTGAVVPAAGDYTASEITNVAAGNISATDVQAAINELDTEKAPVADPSFTGVPILPPYTLATLPTVVEGGIIFVTDANSGAGAMCYGQVFGSPDLWIDVTTGVAVV